MSVTKNSKYCRQCGSQIKPGDSFCPFCGAANYSKVFCHVCGAANIEGQLYCEVCGSSLKAETEYHPQREKTSKQPTTQHSIPNNHTKPISINSWSEKEVFAKQEPTKKANTEAARPKKNTIRVVSIACVICFLLLGGLWSLFSEEIKAMFGKDGYRGSLEQSTQLSVPEAEQTEDNSYERLEVTEEPQQIEAVDNSIIAYESNSDGLSWTLDDSGFLRIEGNGVMWTLEDKHIPWRDFQEEITSVELTEGITAVGHGAFMKAVNLQTVVLPVGLTDVYPDAFSACTSLTKIVFQDGLKKLWMNSFNSCNFLQEVWLPASLEEIESNVFSFCDNLGDIYYEGTMDDWRQIKIETRKTGQGIGNSGLIMAIIHCSDGDIEPMETQPLPDDVTELMQRNVNGASWNIYARDINGTFALTSKNAIPMSASAMIIVPILYTVAAESDAGNLSLADSVTITMSTTGRTQLGGSVGKSISIEELCKYMLRYSDNIATNTLMQYLGFTRIIEVCNDYGYLSVSLANYLMHTEDNTTNDNYISVSALCGMLADLYSDKFESLGKQFLQDNMVIQDSTAREGLIAGIPTNLTVMNLNGQKANKYNEVVIVDDGSSAYVIAFMSNNGTLASLKQAAKDVGAYLVNALQVGR